MNILNIALKPDISQVTFGNIRWDQIPIVIIISLLTTLFMSMSELSNQAVKTKYNDTFGYNSWDTVFRNSFIISLLSGILAGITTSMVGDGHLTFYFTNITSVLGYISIQAIATDFNLKLVDRYMLRLGYFDTFLLTMSYLYFSYGTWQVRFYFFLPVAVSYLSLFLIFLFSRIGASDVRAIVVFLPFTAALHMALSVFMFIFVGLLTAVFMQIMKYKNHNPQYSVPILPFLTVPYMFLLPLYPLIYTIYTSGKL